MNVTNRTRNANPGANCMKHSLFARERKVSLRISPADKCVIENYFSFKFTDNNRIQLFQEGQSIMLALMRTQGLSDWFNEDDKQVNLVITNFIDSRA